jgi:hypothetical protein
VLAKFLHLESIPADWREWKVNAANAATLSRTLTEQHDLAMLFRDLATLRTEIPLFETVDQLEWRGSTPEAVRYAARFDAAK